MRELLFFATIFLLAFLANLGWEFSHAGLYVQYRGDEITDLILIRAALFDAGVITLFAVPLFLVPLLRARLWVALIVGFMFAVGLEWFALFTGRWEYNDLMPIIPFLNIGLSPSVQLGLTGWATYLFARFLWRSASAWGK